MIKDSGDRTEFETGAKRDMRAGKGRMDLLPWYGIMEVSKHCEEGALKYGEHNVDKGIPLHSLLDSASRHLAKYMVGMDDEDHLRAACWNLLWALNQRETHPELDDRFAVKVGEVKKKNYQVLCPNCEATIIKENGQICDGVAWRVGVPNEKVELKCNYCNHSVIVSIKDIRDDRFSVKRRRPRKNVLGYRLSVPVAINAILLPLRCGCTTWMKFLRAVEFCNARFAMSIGYINTSVASMSMQTLMISSLPLNAVAVMLIL